jgi:hypothetical protein
MFSLKKIKKQLADGSEDKAKKMMKQVYSLLPKDQKTRWETIMEGNFTEEELKKMGIRK